MKRKGKRSLQWLMGEINDTWEHRGEIAPRYEGIGKPKVIEILRLLPKTNCRECGQPTCMVFATQVAEGGKGPGRLPTAERRQQTEAYRNISGSFNSTGSTKLH